MKKYATRRRNKMLGKIHWNEEMTICTSQIIMKKDEFERLAKESHLDNTGEPILIYNIEGSNGNWILKVLL